jgi:hypothetical protein
MKPLPTYARVLARDLGLTAAHEAAHVVVARPLGVDAFAWLWLTRAKHAGNGRLVLGRCQLLDPPASDHHCKLIGVAGAVGELLLHEMDFYDGRAVHKSMSRTDCENAAVPHYSVEWSWSYGNQRFADTVREVDTLLRGELAREWRMLAWQLAHNANPAASGRPLSDKALSLTLLCDRGGD